MNREDALQRRADFVAAVAWAHNRPYSQARDEIDAEAKRRFPITERRHRVGYHLGMLYRFVPNEDKQISSQGWIEGRNGRNEWVRGSLATSSDYAVPLARLWLDLAANPWEEVEVGE